MTDVITLSDDDFTPPATQLATGKRVSSSGHRQDKTARQWNDIFAYKSRREWRDHGSASDRPSHRSSDHSSKRPPDRSSKHSSHHSSSEGHSRHSSSTRNDKDRHRRERHDSRKSIIEIDVSDDDAKSSASSYFKKATPEKHSSGRGSKDSPNHRQSKKSSHRSSSEKSSHRHSEKRLNRDSEKSSSRHSDKGSNRHSEKSSNNHHSRSSNHQHSNKSSPQQSSYKSMPEKTSSARDAPERTSSAKDAQGRSTLDIAPASLANGRPSSTSRRSLAAELGVSKAECRRTDDDPSPRQDQLITNGQHRPAQAKRPADGGGQAAPLVKRARLTRVEPETGSDASSQAAPEPEPESCPCEQSLEEVCRLLKPLLSGPELKLEAKVRRRHGAVLALAGGKYGRKQHLAGVTRQCAERLRAEPERCFTVLRGFLEQLDQIKIVASSAQSRTGPAPAAAAGKAGTGTAAGVTKAAAASTAASAAVRKSAADAVKAKPSPPVKANGAAPSAAGPEQDEKETRRHRRHVAKLEKTLRRLEREIVRQDEQEVDWEDAADSAYIIGARLKRRYVQVYRYYCRLVGAAEEAQRLESRRIRFDGTRYPAINRRIEKFVNQTREFPDFKDVLSLIETANRRDRLQLGPGALRDQAKEAFLQLGAQLQKRRRAALAESMDSVAGAAEWRGRDPAAGDPALGVRLAENAAAGTEKLNQVFREFVDRQETAAAERRQRRTDAAGGSGEDEAEDDDEEEPEDEEGEESEVTDEELEPEPAGGDRQEHSDDQDDDTQLSDAEMTEPQEGAVKEEREVDSGKAPVAESDADRTEEAADGHVEGPTASRDENDTGDASHTGQSSSDDTRPVASKESETSEVKAADENNEDDPDPLGKPEDVDQRAES